MLFACPVSLDAILGDWAYRIFGSAQLPFLAAVWHASAVKLNHFSPSRVLFPTALFAYIFQVLEEYHGQRMDLS